MMPCVSLYSVLPLLSMQIQTPTAAPGPPTAPTAAPTANVGLNFDTGVSAGSSVPEGYNGETDIAFGGFVAVNASDPTSKYHLAMVSPPQVHTLNRFCFEYYAGHKCG